MKNKIRFISLMLVMLCTVGRVLAYDVKIEGIYYNLDQTNKTASVTKNLKDYERVVTIPSSIVYAGATFHVTHIEGNAFDGCTDLTGITIPNSVISIGREAFKNCESLNDISISDSVISIGEAAFDNTAWFNTQAKGVVYVGKAVYKYKGIMPDSTSIVLKDNTTCIADFAFYGCEGLTSITIPNSVISIGLAAFFSTKLTDITIPNSVTSVGASAFVCCAKMVSFNVDVDNPYYCSSDGVLFNKSQSELIAYPCGKVGSSYTIPESVTYIGKFAFYGCMDLVNIDIPNTVTSIGGYALNNTAWYDKQPNGLVYAGNCAYKYKGFMANNNVINLRDGTVYIADFAFKDCLGLTSITIPISVTAIADFTFCGCTGLTSIIIPDSITTIGLAAFYGCTDLISVTIGHSVATIGLKAFAKCPNINNVTSLNPIPPTLDYVVFDDVAYSNATLKVPNKEIYKAAGEWSNFKTVKSNIE